MKFLKIFSGVVIFFGGIWGSCYLMYILPCPFVVPGIISLLALGCLGCYLFVGGLGG